MALKRCAADAFSTFREDEGRDEDNGSPSRDDLSSVPNTLQNPLNLSDPLPRLIVLDLDKTVWPVYCHEETKGPYTRRSDSAVECLSQYGQEKVVQLYSEVVDILGFLQQQRGIRLAVASRSPVDEGGAARGILGTLGLLDLFCCLEIHRGSKATHFKNIHVATGIPYRDMLFFDDEKSNVKTVSKLGVTSVKLSKESGLTCAAVNSGLKRYREAILSRSSLRGWLTPASSMDKAQGGEQATKDPDDCMREGASWSELGGQIHIPKR